MFPFDAELMSSPVYQRAVQSPFRRPIWRVKGTDVDQDQQTSVKQILEMERKEQASKSESIENMIRRDKLVMGNEVKLALLGKPGDAIDFLVMLLRTMKS